MASRARWRDGGSTPSLLTPNTMYQLNVDLWSTSYIFNAGHSVRVAVSSSNYPRFDTNPNNGLPLTQKGPVLWAHNTIFMGGNQASHLLVPFVSQSLDSLLMHPKLMAKIKVMAPRPVMPVLSGLKEQRRL